MLDLRPKSYKIIVDDKAKEGGYSQQSNAPTYTYSSGDSTVTTSSTTAQVPTGSGYSNITDVATSTSSPLANAQTSKPIPASSSKPLSNAGVPISSALYYKITGKTPWYGKQYYALSSKPTGMDYQRSIASGRMEAAAAPLVIRAREAREARENPQGFGWTTG